ESHRLLVLECALLKSLMLILDWRIREYSEDARLLPRSQNAFRAGYFLRITNMRSLMGWRKKNSMPAFFIFSPTCTQK
ncbi:hypothetical protein B0H19DRAFT_948342, partial [Mycena capillaripes]